MPRTPEFVDETVPQARPTTKRVPLPPIRSRCVYCGTDFQTSMVGNVKKLTPDCDCDRIPDTERLCTVLDRVVKALQNQALAPESIEQIKEALGVAEG